jgi:hypothetical protein
MPSSAHRLADAADLVQLVEQIGGLRPSRRVAAQVIFSVSTDEVLDRKSGSPLETALILSIAASEKIEVNLATPLFPCTVPNSAGPGRDLLGGKNLTGQFVSGQSGVGP